MKELSVDKNKSEELATDRSKWKSYFQATSKSGEKYNHCLRKQTQAQEKLNTDNFIVANTVTDGLDP